MLLVILIPIHVYKTYIYEPKEVPEDRNSKHLQTKEINRETRGEEEIVTLTLPILFVDKEIDEEDNIEKEDNIEQHKGSYAVTEDQHNDEGSGEAEEDVENADDREEEDSEDTEKARQPKAAKGQNRCRFRVPAENRTIAFPCGARTGFTSIVKSVCKTQLGNQLSSLAALVYFQEKHGMHAFLDPTQTRALGQVFDKARLGVGAFDFYRCGCRPGQQNWVRPLKVDGVTGVATGLAVDPATLATDTLVGLGAHTTPVFLFQQVMDEVRSRLVFKPKILDMAKDILDKIREEQGGQKVVVVGVHARRGDKLAVWRRSGAARGVLGRYEPRFFHHCMGVMRRRYGGNGTRVAFLVTSDNPAWARHHLAAAGVHFPGDYTRAPSHGITALGLDLALLSLSSHTIMDYGTFGLWGGLLAGGDILAPRGYTSPGRLTPDLVWWAAATTPGLQLVDIRNMTAI